MRHRNLPRHIRVKVAEYYDHRFRKKFFDEENILAELSKGLREVYCVQLLSPYIVHLYCIDQENTIGNNQS